MVLSRTDRVSIFSQGRNKELSARTLATARTTSTSATTRSSSMRDLLCRQLSFGMESVASQQGGFDDIYPSDDITVLDKDEYEATEATYMETTNYSDDSFYNNNNNMLCEVPPAPTSVQTTTTTTTTTTRPKHANNKNNNTRRGSTDTKESATRSLHSTTPNSPRRKRQVVDHKRPSNRPTTAAAGVGGGESPRRRTMMKKACSERLMLRLSHHNNTSNNNNNSQRSSRRLSNEHSQRSSRRLSKEQSQQSSRRLSKEQSQQSSRRLSNEHSPRSSRRLSHEHSQRSRSCLEEKSPVIKCPRPEAVRDAHDKLTKSPKAFTSPRPKRNTLASPRRNVTNSPHKERRSNQVPMRQRRPASPKKERRIVASPVKESSMVVPATPNNSSVTARCVSPVKEIMIPTINLMEEDDVVPSSPRSNKRATSPVKEVAVPATPVNSSSTRRSTATCPEDSPRRVASPLCKANFVPRVPLSPARTRQQQVMMPSKDVIPTSPQQRFDKRRYQRNSDNNLTKSNMEKFSMSDSRLCYNHMEASTSSLGMSGHSIAMSQHTTGKRRQSSRHPKSQAAVLDPKRRVAPQRSRSLTDLRDMLRPKSDPRHKPRSTLVEKQCCPETNPLDSYFSSQVTVAPPTKDSVTVAGATPLSPLAKRPLARRLERHRRLSSRKLLGNLEGNAADVTEPTHSVKAPLSPSKGLLPEQLASLKDMSKEDWASVRFPVEAL